MNKIKEFFSKLFGCRSKPDVATLTDLENLKKEIKNEFDSKLFYYKSEFSYKSKFSYDPNNDENIKSIYEKLDKLQSHIKYIERSRCRKYDKINNNKDK